MEENKKVPPIEHEANVNNKSTDRDVFLISGDIDYHLFEEITQAIKARIKDKTKKKNCWIVLTTPGGDPNAGYRIARCFQKNYEHIRLIVASYCKSAGTLMAIAADEIAFGPMGELGPLDIQVLKKDEFADFSSGLDIIEAMEAIADHTQKFFTRQLFDLRLGTRISTRLAGELAAKITSSIAAPLYSQIDPQRVAEMQRAMSIALKYGQMLEERPKSLKKKALEQLVRDYPTHSFVIDVDEAKNLFNNIKEITEEEELILDGLWNFLRAPLDGRRGLLVDSYDNILERVSGAKNVGTKRNETRSKKGSQNLDDRRVSSSSATDKHQTHDQRDPVKTNG